ncbi:MAG: PilZ domain-containing protein [Planctomycetota bacterium]|jgi:hypothetical protein
MNVGLYYSAFGFLVGLTPVERWKAAGDRLDNGFTIEGWFTPVMLAVVIILSLLLLLVSLRRRAEEQKGSQRLFVDYAQRRGLTESERQVLLATAAKAGLKRSSAVFTMEEAFDRGATRMIQEFIDRGPGAEETVQLRRELSCLREKLGFQKEYVPSIGSMKRSRKLSSRQIPAGRKVHITRRINRNAADIEAIVVENNDSGLTVKSAEPLRITLGDMWRVRYYFGASIWEFDTTVVSCEGDILVLNHNDNIRFINRRRFLRVPVKKPVFFARFPFGGTVSAETHGVKKFFTLRSSAADTPGALWGPPKFVAGVVTELAGPGLRIEVPVEAKAGERVLVVMRLDEEGPSGVKGGQGKTAGLRVVQDVGEVRHVETVQNGFSVAVELTGLSDSDVDELIRAANLASVKANAEGPDRQASATVEASVPEPASV